MTTSLVPMSYDAAQNLRLQISDVLHNQLQNQSATAVKSIFEPGTEIYIDSTAPSLEAGFRVINSCAGDETFSFRTALTPSATHTRQEFECRIFVDCFLPDCGFGLKIQKIQAYLNAINESIWRIDAQGQPHLAEALCTLNATLSKITHIFGIGVALETFLRKYGLVFSTARIMRLNTVSKDELLFSQLAYLVEPEKPIIGISVGEKENGLNALKLTTLGGINSPECGALKTTLVPGTNKIDLMLIDQTRVQTFEELLKAAGFGDVLENFLHP